MAKVELTSSGKRPDEGKNDQDTCAELFADPTLALPTSLGRSELPSILQTTNKMRNDWGGHGGIVGNEEAKVRNELLLTELQKLREVFADVWTQAQLIHALHCRPRRGIFENEVAVLMGNNTPFRQEIREMTTWLDVERIYLSTNGSGRALKLLPLIRVGASPPTAKNACYFFNRLEKEGARFVSYHYADCPELKEAFVEATEAINFLIGE